MNRIEKGLNRKIFHLYKYIKDILLLKIILLYIFINYFNLFYHYPRLYIIEIFLNCEVNHAQ